MLRNILLNICILGSLVVYAESWDQIKESGDYYWGVGYGATSEEADQMALANLTSNIALHVSSDFSLIDEEHTVNNEISHESRVQYCIKSYAGATLTNTEHWEVGVSPNLEMRRWIRKSELARIFEGRITKARDMVRIADKCLETRRIDTALQYYYWAYSLIRSVQFPNEVTDESGHILVSWIPVKIDEILSNIEVKFDNCDGDVVNMLFSYKGEPVSTVDYKYSDGRDECIGSAKNGRGALCMAPDHETDVYHIDIEYEFKSLARSDSEMRSVLDIITPRSFPKASMAVNAKGLKNNEAKALASKATVETNHVAHLGFALDGAKDEDNSQYAHIIDKIAKSIATRSYSDAISLFTIDGLAMYNRLITYGSARIVGTPEIKYYKGLGGRTIARGLQMAFTFQGRKKKTFVEDITFTFNSDNKIENVAFGLGKVAEDGILNRTGAAWREDVRETIVEFMENYKTAYSLEDLDYIRNIFADDATIIVGNVARPRATNQNFNDGMTLSIDGQKNIQYNRYTKDQYIQQLARCFGRNDFINLKFTDHQIQWLEKFEEKSIFAINIRQQYDSSTYADDGYLFLLVDMTNRDEPQIKIRTWQPNEVSLDRLYNAGDFFPD